MEKFILENEFTEGLKLIKMNPFKDERGEYVKSYSDRELALLGINTKFLEDNYLISKKGSIRGLHYQIKNPEEKLIRCLKGKIMDVTVDIRKDSPTYKNVFKIILKERDNRILMVPKGFAHGFISLTDSVVFYKSSNYYFPDDQYGISFFSNKINLDEILKQEGIENKIITEKDINLLKLED
ncbi:dTDP-4-dehydrorhamnose 3,5-epimerase family protein [uncultured Ilyobacter sp.]|uniref:dTDP-4-dehydrorhamnose 3,5-epimerase family protein n=1 Tax=uncultured Ilyobacter sp. TaxID=544433 RepID=UPI002AA61E51|nr:dTDP-4-dehydrorhamnose 3,5-epimerase family protein [uncultured Ilyobacter sp.]